MDSILRFKHHELRMNGYLDFYKKIYNHHRLPFYVVSLWTANLLFIQTLVEHLYRDKFEMQCLEAAFFSPSNSLLCLISSEVFILWVINFNYIGEYFGRFLIAELTQTLIFRDCSHCLALARAPLSQ